jgi:hypothetical protein
MKSFKPDPNNSTGLVINHWSVDGVSYFKRNLIFIKIGFLLCCRSCDWFIKNDCKGYYKCFGNMECKQINFPLRVSGRSMRWCNIQSQELGYEWQCQLNSVPWNGPTKATASSYSCSWTYKQPASQSSKESSEAIATKAFWPQTMSDHGSGLRMADLLSPASWIMYSKLGGTCETNQNNTFDWIDSPFKPPD